MEVHSSVACDQRGAIRKDHLGPLVSEKPGIALGLQGICTEDAMFAEQPEVSRLRHRRRGLVRRRQTDGGGRRPASRNLLGEPLEICSIKPMTRFYRDGCCDTGREDFGSHTVCAVLTSDFLEFSKSRGNDLSTPMPEFGFPGLKPGDRWCLCAPRWREAFEAKKAPRVVLRATHEAALANCSLADLKHFAVDLA
jgi:uncharacterized protein